MTTHDPYALPSDLPVPDDDGAADHLLGMAMPDIALAATTGRPVNLREASRMSAVFYVYPRTGSPGVDPLPGWDAIPGTRGCTPQSCAFRDHYRELCTLGADVFSVQDTGA